MGPCAVRRQGPGPRSARRGAVVSARARDAWLLVLGGTRPFLSPGGFTGRPSSLGFTGVVGGDFRGSVFAGASSGASAEPHLPWWPGRTPQKRLYSLGLPRGREHLSPGYKRGWTRVTWQLTSGTCTPGQRSREAGGRVAVTGAGGRGTAAWGVRGAQCG